MKLGRENAEIRGRGQLTIPKSIRDSGRLREGCKVSIIPVGESLLVAPYHLHIEDARREIRKVIAASGVSAEHLFSTLVEERDKGCGPVPPQQPGLDIGNPISATMSTTPCGDDPVPPDIRNGTNGGTSLSPSDPQSNVTTMVPSPAHTICAPQSVSKAAEYVKVSITLEPEMHEWLEDLSRSRRRAKQPWKMTEIVREALGAYRGAQKQTKPRIPL